MPFRRAIESKRVPRWIVGLMLVGALGAGTACETNIEGEDGVEEDVDVDEDDEDADVDTDVDVDEDTTETDETDE